MRFSLIFVSKFQNLFIMLIFMVFWKFLLSIEVIIVLVLVVYVIDGMVTVIVAV